jgi:hypothetical protein
MGALRIHRRQTTWRGDMSALRAALGIAPEVYKDFAQLRRKVLQTAKSEIDQLAHFTVEWREIRHGRAISEIEFRFEPKDAPAQLETVDEISKHSAGRRARREDAVQRTVAVEAPVLRLAHAAPPALPATKLKPPVKSFPPGSLRYAAAAEEFYQIGRTHGGGWDVDMIANAYREQMGDRLARLNGAKLRASWQGFCESFAARRGRPD